MTLKNNTFFRIITIIICLVSYIITAQSEQVFKIGALVPLSGEQQTIGKSVESALKGALTDVNNYLQPLSAKVELSIQDTAADPDIALSALEALNSQGIQIVIGPVFSSSAQKCLKFANKNKIVMISPTSTSTSLKKDDYLFRLLPPDNLQGAALAYFVSEQGIKQVLPVYINDTYGKGLAQNFTKSAQNCLVLQGIEFKPEEISEQILIDRVVTAASELDSKDSAILFIGHGDVKTFFHQASQEESLKQFTWICSEALLASCPNILDDPAMASFAASTSLSTVNLHADDILFDLYGQYIYNSVKKLMPESEQTPGHYIYPAWNSLWLAAEASRLVTKEEEMTTKQAITYLGEGDTFYGMNPLYWDRNGDRCNGKYYLLQANSAGTAWNTRAICEFNPNWAEPQLKWIESINPSSSFSETINLNGLFAVTGGGGTTQAQKGFELAVEHINTYISNLKIGGSFIPKCYDTETDPATGLNIARELYNRQNVKMVVGPCVSSVVDNIASDLPDLCMVSPTSTALSLAENDDMIARLSPCDTAQAEALTALINSDGVDMVACIYRDDIWGKGIVEAFSTAYSGTVKAIPYGVDMTDFSDLVVNLEDIIQNNPAAKKAVLLVSFDEGADIFKALDEQSPLLKISWYGTDGLANSVAITGNETIADKAIEARLQCSIYSPDITGMLSPRLLLFNQWINGNSLTAANPMTLVAYDSTWLTALAYINEGNSATSSALWKRLLYQADILNGFSYSTLLNNDADRSVKYYSFYRVNKGTEGAEWKLSASYIDSGIGLNSLKHSSSVIDKETANVSLNYKRLNAYKNGIKVAETPVDKINAMHLPLGDCIIPGSLILESGFMTGTLTVYVDGNAFSCVTENGNWTWEEEQDIFTYVTDKEKMAENYFPMKLIINQTVKAWSFQATNTSFDNLDWSDGLELRIDINRIPGVVINFKPEINVKWTFNSKCNGVDNAPANAGTTTFEEFGIDKLTAGYSTHPNKKHTLIINRGVISANDNFDPVNSGMTLNINNYEVKISTGADWGAKTSYGIFLHKWQSNNARNHCLFDLNKQKWRLVTKSLNTIELANSFGKQQGLLVTLNVGTEQGVVLLKPTVTATLKVNNKNH